LVIDIRFKNPLYSIEDNNSITTKNKVYISWGDQPDFVGSLGSCIGIMQSKHFTDKGYKILNPEKQRMFRRLKKNYDMPSRIKGHETEYRVFNILNKITIALNLNKNVKKNSAYYYRKILKAEGRVFNNISLLAFCIYYASREDSANSPITIREISEAFRSFGHRARPKLILRDGLYYKRHLNPETRPHKTEDYVNRLINNIFNYEKLEERMKYKGVSWTKLEYQGYLTQKCFEILKRLSFKQRGGRNPYILTGAVIYLADKMLGVENKQKTILTQKIIYEATKIAEYSIRDHYVNLLKPLFFY